MIKPARGLIILSVLLLAGCKTIPVAESSYSDKGILLDQVNAKVKSDSTWFDSLNTGRQKITQKYNGELSPGMAVYLENNIYIYEDKNLSTYLLKIADRLLQNWEGVKPDLSVVIETDEHFNAYVDELNQLHVSTGLLRALENEDQLASVLAHEISHVLLKHNREKSLANSTTSALEIGGLLAAAAGSYASQKKGNTKYQKQGANALLGFQSMGLVWADILSPNWSRQNEREADRMGMDMLIRANYNYEEFPVVIEKIHDAGAKRSERVEMFSQLSDSLIQTNKNKAYKPGGNEWDKALGDMQVALAQSATKSGFDALASSNKSHESRATRIDALKTYLNTAHGGGELPPEISVAPFKSAVHNATSKAQLDQDFVAIETINALNTNDLNLAKTKYKNLQDNSRNYLASSSIAKSSVEMSSRKYGAAINNLVRLVNRKNAPAEAYIKLASLYISSNKYSRADDTLRLGVSRIGRDYKFLPALVYLNKVSGDLPAAEENTIKCKKYDTEIKTSFAQKVLNANSGASNSYYRKCATVLGYDVIAKRQQQREQQLKAQRENTLKMKEALKGLFKK